MRKALSIWSPFTRSSSEMSITPSSHAYSTNRFDAMMKKCWFMVAIITPMMTANVMVVVAMVMLLRFFLNSSVRKRLGSTQRKNTRFSNVAMTA